MQAPKFKKVIIWGYHPAVNQHTHSFTHAGWYEGFKYLGYDVYWFDDKSFPDPKDFSYDECLFITEGFADKNIPINKTSTYLVHIPTNIDKYINGAKKFIDLRYNERKHFDEVYNYTFDRAESKKIGSCFYFEKSADYDRIYCSWGTIENPKEIMANVPIYEYERTVHFIGTIGTTGKYENWSNLQPFIQSCEENGIQFIHHDPWRKVLPESEVKRLTRISYLSPDIRSKAHLEHGYVPCRILRNMGYGVLGITNSYDTYIELDRVPVYEPNISKLFESGVAHRKVEELLDYQQRYVLKNHTFAKRADQILEVVG